MKNIYFTLILISICFTKAIGQCADSLTISSNNFICIGNSATLTANLYGTFDLNAVTYSWSPGGQNTASITVSPNNQTTYTCTVSINTCSDLTKSKIIFVSQVPTVNAGINQTICADETVVLNGTYGGSATTANWSSSGDGSFTNINTSNGNITANYNPGQSDLNLGTVNLTLITDDPGGPFLGCSAASDQITISINPLPNVNAGANQTVCAGNSVILTATGANYFSWNNNVSNGIAFSPSATTTYTVTGTNTSTGCTNTDQVIVSVNPLPIVNAGSNQTVCAGNLVTLTATGANSYSWTNNVSNGVAFSPGSTITYIVTGTNTSTGCTNTDQVIVTVNPLPIVNAGSNQTVCAGNLVTLSGAGANTYLWNNGVNNNVPFTPSTTTTYTVTGTNTSTGCTSTDQVTITINPLPTLIAGANQTVCAGNSVTLTATGANSFSWSNNVSNGVAFSPSTTTTYTVTGTNTSTGCNNTDQVIVTVNPLPIVNASQDQLICEGQTASLSVIISPGLNYSWSSGEIGSIIVVSLPGDYIVTAVNNVTGCINKDTVNVSFSIPQSSISNSGTDSFCEGSSVVLTVPYNTNSSYQWNRNGNAIPGAIGNEFEVQVGGWYKINVLDSLNCAGVDSTLIQVNPIPDNPLIIGNSTLCLNMLNQVYTTNPTSNYLIWEVNGANIYSGQYTNELHINVTSTDTVTVNLISQDVNSGCFSANELSVVIDADYTAPDFVSVIPMGSQNDFLCAPGTSNVIRWGKLNKTTNEITLFPTTNVYMDFVYIDTITYFYFVDHGLSNECFTRSYYIYPDVVTGFDEVYEFHVSVYPNPALTNINIEVNEISLMELIIENIEGKTMTRTNFIGHISLPIESWNSGIYFAKIHSNNKIFNYKFTKF